MAGVPPASLLWLGLLEGPSGYADEARGFLRALERAGLAPAARSLAPGDPAALGDDDRRMLDRQRARAEGADPAVVVHHYAPAWARATPEVAGAANVARTMFETDRVPEAWLDQLLRRDEVWVPSEHGREAFERGGVPSSRLRVIGGTLDFDVFAPGAEPLALDAPDGHLVFLSTFDFSPRKGWEQLLLAWARAFAPTDPVCLVLKTSAREGAGALRERVAAAGREAARRAGRTATAPVRLETRTLAPSDLARLYAAADAFVLASRGEGWGRPYMEALATGLPTIGSAWSGNTEFMRPETSWLVEGTLVPVPDDHATFADPVAGHRWFEPDPDALAAALAEVAADPAAARRRAAPARADLIERFGPEATAARIAAAAAEVAGRAAGRDRAPVVVRGPFGRNSSLSTINDLLVREVEAAGGRAVTRPAGSPAEPVAAPSVSHSWPPDFGAGSDGPAVVILPWEYGDPPAEWVRRAREELDLVLVPSDYVRDGYVAAGMPPGAVEVVPNGVDLELFTPVGPARDLGRTAATVFLSVGGTIWRKGPDLLTEAWARAFAPGDDVLLVVKDFGDGVFYDTAADAMRAFAARDDVAPVLYLPDHLAPEELPALYRAADVLVAPYRGEGFGMPILEAMACGVPAIHTAAGPSREFAGPDAGWAVDARRVELDGRVGAIPLAGPGYVHEVDVDALATALRAAAASPEERRRRGAAARRRAQAYGWDAIAARYLAALDRLSADGLPPARTIAPAQLDGRATTVLYAPDWDDEAEWAGVLDAWARHVAADADATLVLPVERDRGEALAARALEALAGRGHDAARLPDLALQVLPPAGLAPLVAAADAVLLGPGQATAPPAVVRRRARRLLTVADLPGLGFPAVPMERAA